MDFSPFAEMERTMQYRKFSDELAILSDQFSLEQEYWLKQLAGDLVKSGFPYDFKKTDGDKPVFVSQRFVLPGEVFAGLEKLSNRSYVRLHMILVTGILVLLYKYTGCEDIVLGLPIYKQEREAEFINTALALRNPISGDMTFKELLLQVKQSIVEADTHQNYPIEMLLRDLNIPSSDTDFPLFDLVVLLENIHDKKYVQYLNPTVIFSFFQGESQLEGEVEFNSLLYRGTTIKRIVAHLRNLLAAVLTDVEVKAADINILSAQEQRQILAVFNDTATAYPQGKTIHRLFEEQALKTPHRLAVGAAVDLEDIYGFWQSGSADASLFEKMASCCFRANPYLFRSPLPGFHHPHRLEILKTHRHNGLLVNRDMAKLTALFDGKRNNKAIFSGLQALDPQPLLFLYSTRDIDLLGLTFAFNSEPERLSIETFRDFMFTVQSLFRHHLIRLVGVDRETLPLDIPLAGYFDNDEEEPPRVDWHPGFFHHKEAAGADVLLLGDGPGVPTTGLLYLAAYLRRNGLAAACQFYDPATDYRSLKKNLDELLEKIRPKIVAVSLKWFLYIARVLDICKIVKAFSAEIKVVAGGNTASYYWQQVIRFEAVDFVVRGDGEVPLLHICREQDAAGIPNIVYKRGGDVIENPLSYVQDEESLEDIYLSHLDEILLSDYASILGTFYINTHKGCVMNCLYCGGCRQAQQETFGRTAVRRRGVEAVRRDIEAAKKYASTFQFDLDVRPEDLEDYCRKIWAGLDLSAHFCIFSSLTLPSPSLIKLVCETFKYVYFDIDVTTLSQRHRQQLFALGLVKPQPTDAQILAFLDRCEKYENSEVRLNLITGLPYFTSEDIKQSEEFLSLVMHTCPRFGELHWARLHAQPGAPILQDPGRYRMHAYAARFEDFLSCSEKNFNRESAYPAMEHFNYPYIYFQDDGLNSGVSQFYLENNLKVRQHRESRRWQGQLCRGIGYGELNRKADQLAALLRAEGVRPNDMAAIMLEPSLNLVVALLGVLKAGAAYLPIDPGYPEMRVQYMLRDSGSRLLITTAQFVDRLDFVGGVVNMDDRRIWEGKSSDMGQVTNDGDIVYAIYTSGTTGRAKGVLVRHESLVNYVDWFSREVGLGGEDRAIFTSSFAFDLGYTALYPPILRGGECHVLPRDLYLSPEKILVYMKNRQISYIKMTPSLFKTLVNSPAFGGRMCPRFRLAVLGGEAIDVGDIEQAHGAFKDLVVMNHYGPTEATIGCIRCVVDFSRFEAYKGKPVIGKPIANTAVYILDRELRLLPVGVPGELCISGVCLARGYLNRPEFTAEKFITAPAAGRQPQPPKSQTLYRSGDLARRLPDGSIEFLGRRDHQVKIRGYRIELGEIETQLLNHPGISGAVVVDRQDGDGARFLCAYLVPRQQDGAGSETGDERKKAGEAGHYDGRYRLTEEERARYHRQMLLAGWGVASQEKLKGTTVFVAGAGGGASPTITQLALAGVGTIIICDYDRVERSNLNRQFLHDESRIGMNKAVSAAMTVSRLNPHVKAVPIDRRLTRQNVFELVGRASVIFDMLDDLEAKFILSECAVAREIPQVVSAMIDLNAYAAIFHAPKTPCFHCLFDEEKYRSLTEGMRTAALDYRKRPLHVLASSLFVGTGAAVIEAIKIILGIENPAYNKFLLFNHRASGNIVHTDGYQMMTYAFSEHFRKLSGDQGFDWDRGFRGKILEELSISPDLACPLCGDRGRERLAALRERVENTAIEGQGAEDLEVAVEGDQAAAILNSQDGDESLGASALRQYLSGTLPDYMVPAYFVQLAEIPLTANGKIDREALPEPGTGGSGRAYAAPRNGREAALVRIWSGILDREADSISIETSFFELGGHSLKVTTMAERIQQAFGVTLPLAEIFRLPRISDLSAYIAEAGGGDVQSMGDDNLVLLKQGSGPANLFLFHAGDGGVDGYMELCRRLSPGMSCWGIRSDKLKDYTPVNVTIEEVAGKYCKKIRQVQPVGPYHLTGWSLGGTIAFEAARQLEAVNEKVGCCALIDALAPHRDLVRHKEEFNLESEFDVIKAYFPADTVNRQDVVRLDQVWPTVIEQLEAGHFDIDILKRAIPQDIAEAIPGLARLGLRQVIEYLNLIRTYNSARNGYIPRQRVDAGVTFFSAAESVAVGADGWNDYCKTPLKEYKISGNHFSILRMPGVTELARGLDQAVNQRG